ncbi:MULTISPECIES: DUF6776 family protein [unclassified Thioalkalivibrio]|uniref:DUF6776 family protein n=1 Tax=unclassified Thioalkalivibrio TaxID=2621013 RepID=UPI000476CC62|nr:MULTISPECIES: DUF6776 family protein [unclassified Thioalkalivibrio]
MSIRVPRLPRRPRIPARRRAPGRGRGVWWVLLLAGALVLALVVGMGSWLAKDLREGSATVDPQAGLDSLRKDLEQEIAARREAEEALLRAEQQMAIKGAEVAAFANDIERQEAELQALREELAFYQRLAEGAGEDGLGIRALGLQRTGQAGVFDVSFQFYRPGLGQSVDLTWSLEVDGVLAGEEGVSTLDAEALDVDSARTLEGLRLLRNQRVRIRLPEGFEPQYLTLRASAEDDEDLEPVSERAEWGRLLEGTQ